MLYTRTFLDVVCIEVFKDLCGICVLPVLQRVCDVSVREVVDYEVDCDAVALSAASRSLAREGTYLGSTDD